MESKNFLRSAQEINEFLSVKLENEKTYIYVDGERFHQCKYLAFNLDAKNLKQYDTVNSIDELEKEDRASKYRRLDIDPVTEFWGHCSNLQAWYENNYDTRILHRNLAFPLLKKLVEAGDKKAKKVLKEEIARRYQSGFEPVQEYLRVQGYLNLLSQEEKMAIEYDHFSFLGSLKEPIFNLLSHDRLYDLKQVKYKFPSNPNNKDAIFAYLRTSEIIQLGYDPFEILGKFRRRIILYLTQIEVERIHRDFNTRRARGEFQEENILKYLIESCVLNRLNYRTQKKFFKERLSILGEHADEILQKFPPHKVYKLIEHLEAVKECEDLHPKSEQQLDPFLFQLLDGLDLYICGEMQIEPKYCPHYQDLCGFNGICMCPNADKNKCEVDCTEKVWNDYAQCMIDLEHFRKTTGKQWPNPEKQQKYQKQKRAVGKPTKYKTLDQFIGDSN
ncbi:MAG: hypothetical protein ACOC4M_07355 [Promethearchaeia archaeon]